MKDSTILFILAFILAVGKDFGWTEDLHPLMIPMIACAGFVCSAIEKLKR